MVELNYSQIASELNGRLIGDDGVMSGVSTDTRSINEGDIFVALQGPNFDGHDFIADAVALGAKAVLVSKPSDIAVTQIVVTDTKLSLGSLAQLWRKKHDVFLIAITGSNGKTTVKEMIAAILSEVSPTLATKGNFNNDIGVPITLLRLNDKHRFAVIEMGANHHGEIEYLVNLAMPDVAMITNAGPSHLEGFGSVRGVAEAKSEILNTLNGEQTAVLNADDDFIDFWRSKNKNCKRLEFSLNSKTKADFIGSYESQNNNLKLNINNQELNIKIPLIGEHNARNALAAIAATTAAGITIDKVSAGLEKMEFVDKRLHPIQGIKGMVILDDTYNANPASLKAGLEVLCSMSGQPWLVLGDMGELGENSIEMHKEVGVIAKNLGVRRIFALGELSENAVLGFGENAKSYSDKNLMIQNIVKDACPGVNILIKGSRNMHMEDVVSELVIQSSKEQVH